MKPSASYFLETQVILVSQLLPCCPFRLIKLLTADNPTHFYSSLNSRCFDFLNEIMLLLLICHNFPTNKKTMPVFYPLQNAHFEYRHINFLSKCLRWKVSLYWFHLAHLLSFQLVFPLVKLVHYLLLRCLLLSV